MKKIAVIMAGCGFLDGGEIHETVTTLLHIYKNGAEALCFAPDRAQETVTNHLTKETSPEKRNILAEAARIARGNIKPLEALNCKDADALVFPGGFGAALNLCNFAKAGAECSVDPLVEKMIRDFHAAHKPLGFICIAPAIAAKVLGPHGVELTIGNDVATAAKLEQMGAKHIVKKVDEIHIDERNRVISTPAYMLAQNIAEVDAGVSRLVSAVLRLSK